MTSHNKDVKKLNSELGQKIQENEKLKLAIKDIHTDLTHTKSELKTIKKIYEEIQAEKDKWREEKYVLIDSHGKELNTLTENFNEISLELGLKNNEIQRQSFILQEYEEKAMISENLGYISSDNESSQEKKDLKKNDHLKKILKEKNRLIVLLG